METGKNKNWFKEKLLKIRLIFFFLIFGFGVVAQPTVTSVVVSDVTLSEPDNGGTVTLTISYSEPMDVSGTNNPTITFNPNPSSLSFVSGSWSGGNVYTATYNVTDDGSDDLDVDIRIKNAVSSPALTTQTTSNNADKFNCKFSKPTVTGIAFNDALLTEGDLPTSFYIEITYSEDMDAGSTTTVSFPTGGEDPTATISAPVQTWPGTNVGRQTFSVADADDNVTNIDCRITGTKDLYGNTVVQYDESSTVFSIDMENPTVSSLTVPVANISDANVGNTYTVIVVFDQTMNTGVDPTIDFPVEDPTSTLTGVSGSWTSGTTFEVDYTIIDANEEVANVDIRVSGGEDINNNAHVATPSFVNKFNIDTKNADVVSVTPNLTEIDDGNIGASTFTLTVLFDEDMDIGAGAKPSVNFDVENPTLTITETSKLWQPDKRTLVATYNVTDVNSVLANVDILTTGGKDLAGNTAQNGDFNNKFSIAMNNPAVTSVTSNLATVKDGDVGADKLVLTINYDMPIATYPTVTFTPALSALNKTNQSALGASITYSYTVADWNELQTGVDVNVSGATIANGNVQAAATEANVFDVDMSNPQVTSVTPNIATLTDNHVGTQTFSLTIVYDKVMDTGVDPTITTPTGGENALASTLTLNGASTWTNSTTYVAYYNVADANEALADVDVQIVNAQDVNSNTQATKLETNVFSVETTNPAITGITANDVQITDTDAGLNAFFVTITYDKDMNTGAFPSVSFQNPIDAGTFAYSSGIWLNSRNCQMTYHISDVSVEVIDVDVYVSGFSVSDLVGNKPVVYTQSDLIDIDTKNPNAITVTESVNPIKDADVGAGNFTLTFDFDQNMQDDGTADPTVLFPVENPSATISQTGITWPSSTQCVVTYTVTDAEQTLSNVDVQIYDATDVAGNAIPAKTFTNIFDIDMANPAVTTMSIISNNTNNTALAKDGDEITVSFIVNRALGALPTATIAGKVATVAPTGGFSYSAKVTVAGGDPEGVVAVTLNFSDVNGNPGTASQLDITNASSVAIDTTAPSAEILAADLTQFGGTSVAISSSGNIANKIWLAAAGKTLEGQFSEGVTMTTSTNGFSIAIPAPGNAGVYYVYVIDEVGNVSVASTKSVTVNNDVTLSAIEPGTITWTEGDAGVQISNTILIQDDSDNIVSASISIANFDSGGDKLVFSNTAKITGTWNPGTGELTLAGNATVLEYQTALRSIAFESISEKPNEALARTVSFRISDGFVNSNVETRTINVVEVNDPPVITSTPIAVGSENEVYAYEITVTDVDDILTWSSVTLPTKPGWLNVQNAGGGLAQIYNQSPVTAAPRSNPVEVLVSDGRGGTDTQLYDIIVSAAITVNPSGGGADYTSLQDALDDPNTVSGDLIELIPGTYNENIVFPAGKDIEVIGDIADPTRVVFVGDGTTATIKFLTSTRTQALRGVTVKNGIGNNQNWVAQTKHAPEAYFGGGIYIEGASPTIEKCLIKNNNAGFKSATNNGGSGGGVYIAKNSNPTFLSTIIEDNVAEIYRGGGVCIDLAQATFTNCIIRNNTSGSYGGGIAIFDSTVTFNGVTVENNTATTSHSEGGGIYLHKATLIQNLVNTISGNTAIFGGANITGYQSTY